MGASRLQRSDHGPAGRAKGPAGQSDGKARAGNHLDAAAGERWLRWAQESDRKGVLRQSHGLAGAAGAALAWRCTGSDGPGLVPELLSRGSSVMHLAAIVFGLVAVASAPAQTVWNISAGADLTQAFAAAAPGDVLQLAPGRYSRFAMTKGLTVLGPAVIEAVQAQGASIPSTVTVPAGQSAHLLGLDFAAIPAAGHSLSVSGSVSMEDCMLGPGDPGAPTLEAFGALVMQRCTVRGGGMWVVGGTVSLSQCTLHGQPATVFSTWAIPALAALHVAAGEVVGSHVTATGGQGAPGSFWPPMPLQPAAPAIAAFGNARVMVSDSSLAGGLGGGGIGAPAIANSSTVAVRHARSTLTGTNGQPSVGNVMVDARLVGMRCDRGLRLGAVSTVTATAGVAQQLLGILGGFDATPSSVFGVSGPVHGVAAGPILLTLAIPPAGAPIATTVAVPTFTGLLGLDVWLQALQFDGISLWTASPVVGGVVH